MRSVDVARQERRACVSMSLLLVFKRFLRQAFAIRADALAAYNPSDKKRASHTRARSSIGLAGRSSASQHDSA